MTGLKDKANPNSKLVSEIEALNEMVKGLRAEVSDTLLASKNIRSQNKIIKLKLDCIKKDRRASKYASIFFFSIGAIVQTVIYFKVLKIDENSKIVSFIVELFKLAGWQ